MFHFLNIKMKFENILNKLALRIPYLRYAAFYRMNEKHRPGHYYSPVVDLKELYKRREAVWKPKTLTGVSMSEKTQVHFLQGLIKWSSFFPFTKNNNEKYRYHFNNNWYSYADGMVLFTMLNHYKPQRVMEVGSGFSSALILDTNEHFLNKQAALTFIEPYPEDRLNNLLRGTDKQNCTVIKDIVQNIPVEVFRQLGANDILLIDNSHVSKTGSDLNYLFTEVLPNLEKGVIIHIHDIFYAFEYPEDWLFEHRLNWNEIYLLHCFLLFNNAFEIIFFSDYMQSKYKETFQEKLPEFLNGRPGSIWLRKIL